MDLVEAIDPIRKRRPRHRHFEYYRSHGYVRTLMNGADNENDCTWVVCRFSPHSETVLYLGDDEGNVGIVDIASVVGSEPNAQVNLIQCFAAHDATVMDVLGVPNNPNKLLSISGDTTVRLWDLQRQESVLFFGHEMSVRSACFAPHCSDVFATGGRDGQIRLWDVRISSRQQQGQFSKNPVGVYRNAHLIKDYKSPRRRSVARLSGRFEKVEPPSVTSLLYANDYTLVSASSCGKSGLRLWDTRRISVKDEGHVLSTLEVPTNKEAGVTSICLDRFGSSFFAAVTDNCVYEYGILTSNTKPLRHFSGAAIESFYLQLQCSPSADYLLCGSKNQQAVIWDLQDLYGSADEYADSAIRRSRALLPKYTLKGHDSEVCCVGWSRSGK
ncbi:WD domain G-beta repeat protein [Trichostrongylus colubriformis]|uniref:WD domain G-beta repeat protein n=1 Tax=Trichostrongylus colubriformis TaxID=6319 RepID=A0AAN8GCX1_TRICO